MSTWVMAVALTAGVLWSKPEPAGCEPVPVYLPYAPVSTAMPAPAALPAAEVSEVAAEAAVADPAVTEEVAAQEAVLEPARLSLPNLSLGHLALDWGVATIGSGTLVPQTPGFNGGMMFPGFGRGGNGSGGGSGFFPGYGPVIYNIINNNGPTPPPPHPVPEPATIAVWCATLAFTAAIVRRSKKRGLQKA
jgi:hypothetical protein